MFNLLPDALKVDTHHADEILQNISDAFFTVDSMWRLTYLNAKAEEWWNRRREDLLGTVLWDMSPEPEKTVGWEMMHKAVNENTSAHWESFSPFLKTWVDISAYPTSGNGLAVYARDISDRKKIEKALLEAQERLAQNAEEKYRMLFENMSEGFTLCELVRDRQGQVIDFRVLNANRAFEVHTGIAVVDAVGRLRSEYIHTRDDIFLKLCVQVVENGKPVHLEQYIQEFGRWLRITLLPLGGEKFAELFKDITLQKKAEDALRKSEEKYRTIVETAGEGIIIAQPEGAITYVNKQAADLFGYSVEEIIGKSSADFSWSDWHPRVTHLRKELQRGNMQKGEYKFRRKDGSALWLQYNAVGMFDDSGRHIANFAMHTDITERKMAEEALRQSEERQAFLLKLSDALRSLSDAKAIQDSATRLLAEHLNVSQSSYTEYSEDHVIIDREFQNDNTLSMKGTYMRSDLSWIIDTLVSGQDVIFSDLAEHTEIPYAQQERWLSQSIRASITVPIFKDGVLVASLSVRQSTPRAWSPEDVNLVHETAERTWAAVLRAQAEQALRESEYLALALVCELEKVKDELTDEVDALLKLHKISTLVLSQKDEQGVFKEILDIAIDLSHADKGNIQIFNNDVQSREVIALKGFSGGFLGNFENTPIASGSCGLSYKERKQVVVEDVQKSPVFEGMPELPYLINENVHACQSTPMISSAGNIIGILSTHYSQPRTFKERELRMLEMMSRSAADFIEINTSHKKLKISEQKAHALVSDLEEADRNKDQFISVLSHELRNPLAAIVAGLSLLDITDNKDQVTKAKDIMRRQSRQLGKLVDDLLELTRITQNKIEMRQETVNLNDIVDNAVSDIRSAFQRKGLQLCVKTTRQPLFLYADPYRINQCISNYLNNALKFTPENGTVWISLKHEKNNAVITVQDTGIGISPDILEQLFKPFIQADHSLDRSVYGGLGLGLSIVKGIVEMHGGKVSVSSPGLGEGAIFTMRLPLGVRNEDSNKSIDTENISRILRILIIEDNKDLSFMLRSILHTLGHQATIAPNGTEGIQAARDLKPDIIFCDIGLPGVNGYDVAKIIRKDDIVNQIFLVALTGYAGNHDVEKALESGFDRHLAKPVSMAMLHQVLNEYIKQRKL